MDRREKLSEQGLAAQVIAWLEHQGWDVYQEVPVGGGCADIVAVLGPLVWVVEVKAALNLSVLDQARRHAVHARWAAVPKASRPSGERELCRKVAAEFLRVGILEVRPETGEVTVLAHAPLLRQHHAQAKQLRARLRPEHKTFAKAGSPSPSPWTPYRDTMQGVRHLLARAGASGLSMGEIMGALERHHYASASSARSAIATALERIEREWCRVEGAGRNRRFFYRAGVSHG